MPTPNADDPLRTTDHATPPEAEGPPENGEASPSNTVGPTLTFQPKPGDTADGSGVPPSEPPSIPGYEVEGLLGRGGMGVVYKARHLALKRTVALKMILAGGHAGPGELTRFRIEAEAVARLQHPNIVQIHEVGEAGGHPYCALEFVEGGSLAARIGGQPQPARESARLVETLARAMQLAHSRNVVHRDLKPANVLLAADGRPKITDFGLARQTDSDSGETQAGQVMGTPSYMAPEQASGRAHEAGPAADVYALGAILYHCLTGRPPFKGETIVETLDLVRNQEPVPPSRLQAGMPLDLETICLKCLRKEPERRYASAQELADDLVRYQQGEPIRARPVGGVERVVKWVKRNPVPTAAAVAVVLALAVGITVGYVNYREAQRNAEEASKQTRIAVKARKNETERANVAERESKRAVKAEDDVLRRLDNSAVLLATAAFDNRDAALARLQLHRVEPKRRGWEWHYLRHQATGGIFTLYGHTSEVKCVAFSPDGTQIATGAQDAPARLWDATTGKPLLELKGNRSPVLSMAFSPDGRRIVTAGFGFGGDKPPEVKVWDTRTGTLLLELPGPFGQVHAVAFSPDGTRIATASKLEGSVRVWDAKTGKVLLELKHPQPVLPGVAGTLRRVICVAFSPDGNRIVTGTETPAIFRGADNVAIVWDAKTGRALAELSGNQDAVVSAAFSPDGNRIVIGCAPLSVTFNQFYAAKVYDSWTGKHQLDLRGHTSYLNSVAFSPDGTRIATGSWDRTARIWDAKKGTSLLELKGHADAVTGVAFSPDGERIVTSSDDRTAKLWDARTGTPQVVALKGQTGTVSCVAFSPDGSRIVTGSDDDFHHQSFQAILPGSSYDPKPIKGRKAVTVWDARTGASLLDLQGHTALVSSASFSSDGNRIVTGSYDKTAKVWNAETGKHLLDLKGHTERLWSVAFSPDNKRVATCSEDKTARIWEVETGKSLLELKGHTDVVTGVAFSPDGARLVTSSADKRALVWDARTGTLIREIKGHTSYVTCVAFSRDGKRILTGGGAGDVTAKVWDAETGELQLDLKGHGSGVVSVAFNRDGTRILTGSQDRTAKVWDAETGIALLDLKGHSDGVGGVAFSPDGTRIALTSSGDHQAKVWDARNATPPLELRGHKSEVKCVAFSQDGTRVVTGSVDRTARVWDTKTGKLQMELKGHTETVFSVAFSPDGTQIATGSADRTAKVWDARTGALQLELKGHKSAVTRVAFSLDGKQIVLVPARESPLVYDARVGLWAFSEMALGGGDRGLIHWEPSPAGMQLWALHHLADQSTVWDARAGKKLKLLDGEWRVDLAVGKAESPSTRIDAPSPPTPPTVPNNRKSPDGRFFAHLDGNHVELIPLSPDEQELAYRRFNTQPSLERYRENYHAARIAREDFTARFYLNLLPPPERAALEAQAALDGGKKDKAIALYRKAIELDPRNASTHLALGTLLSERGQKGEAIALYQKASELDPKRTAPLCDALMGKGQVEAALACLNKALELDRKDTALALRLAALQAWLGQEKEYAATRRRILAFARGTKDAGTANEAARACSILPNSDPAELEAALTLGRRAVKVDPNGVWNLVALGMAEYRSGNFAAAEKTLTAAAARGPTHPQAWILAYYRAMCLHRQGKKAEAQRVAAEAAAKMWPLPADEKNPLSRPEKNPFPEGPNHDHLILWLAYKEAKALIQFEEDRIVSLSNRATAMLGAGKLDQAVGFLAELVTLKKAKLGPSNPDTLNTMTQLGVIYFRLNQVRKAVPLFEEVLKHREKDLGRGHPATLIAIANLGMSYKGSGRLKEAIPLLEEVHSAPKLDPALGWVGGQLLDAYARAGESDKFAALLQKQLADARKVLPADSPQLAGLLAQFGMALLQQKKGTAAEPLLRECLAIREKKEPDAWTTFNTQSMLGGALLGRKKYADAEPLLLKGYEGMKAREKLIPPQGVLRLPEALDRLIELYSATNKPDEAKKWRAERTKYPESRAPEKK